MKTSLLLLVFFITLNQGFSQNPCIRTIKVSNNGNGPTGDCTKKFSGNAIQSANNLFEKDGEVSVSFTSALGSVTPEIVSIRRILTNSPLTYGPYLDRRFKMNVISTERTIATFCFYSIGNLNLLNGSGSTYEIVIQYGTTQQTCTVTEESNITLPVSFKSFNVLRNKANVNLKWQTASEANNRGFNVQRSTNGVWKNIAFVFSQANGGNSSTDLSYEYKDVNTEKGVSQYRIQQVDMDGKASFSEVRSVRGEAQTKSLVSFPNPSLDGKINLVFDDSRTERNVIVHDMSGRIVKQFNKISANNLTMSLPENGMYNIQVIDLSTAEVTVEKVVVKKR